MKSANYMTLLGILALLGGSSWSAYAQEKNTPTQEIVIDKDNDMLEDKDKQQALKDVENEIAFTEGVKFYVLEEYLKALEKFEECYKNNKENAAVNFKIAECHVRLGKYAKAIPYAEKAISLQPKNKFYYWLLAETHKAKEDYKEAIKVYQNLLVVIPNEENIYNELASAYLYINKFDDAIKTYDAAEKQLGVRESIVANKQKIYQATNDSKNAIVEGEKLIKAYPEEADYWFAQVELLLEYKQYAEAEQVLQRYFKNFPEDGHAQLLLSEVYAGNNDLVKQREVLLKAFQNPSLELDSKIRVLANYYKNLQTTEKRKMGLELTEILLKQYGENGKLHQLHGDFLIVNKQPAAARDAYAKALKYVKDNFKNWERVITLDFELKDYAAMLKHTNEVVELYPNHGIFWYYNGTAQLLNQQNEEAIISLEQARTFAGKDPELLFQIYARLGDAYNSTKEYTKSDKYFDKALELKPTDAIVLNNYSYFLSLRKEKLDIAKQLANRLLEISPNNSTYLDTYGWILYVAGDYANAKTYLEKAAQNSQNPTIIEHYGDVLFKLGQTAQAQELWKKAKTLSGNNLTDKLDRKIAEGKLYE